MGCISSKPKLIDFAEGDDKAYMERYLEDRVLGEGAFGVVHLVHDVQATGAEASEPYAAKTLRKGVTFKDNTIYSPIKKEVLRRECDILRVLRGKCYILKLIGIYESATFIRIITEFCSGGEMPEYVINTYGKDGGSGSAGLRTEDVSRISYQLLSAVDHCARHGVIHRDIKPENIMFRRPDRGAELRLIDFGSSSLDSDPRAQSGAASGETEHDSPDMNELIEHSTFAGSAFYIAPEVFQRKGYNSRADVWSAGVTLYVLVAGYPSEDLQKSFNLLQKSKRDLRNLPNMPPNMPDSYFEMLDELLKYRRTKRKSAGAVLGSEFVKFHIDHAEGGGENGAAEDDDVVGMSLDDIAKDANAAGDVEGSQRGSTRGKTISVLLEGSVQRHTLYMQYEKFERSVTTLLATVLNPNQLVDLLNALNNKKSIKAEQAMDKDEADHSSHHGPTEEGVELISNEQKLQIIKIKDLRAILLELGYKEPATMMSDLPNAVSYDSFAYHIALLRQFVRSQEGKNNDLDGSAHRKIVRRLSTIGARGNVSGSGSGGGTLKRVSSGGSLNRSMSVGRRGKDDAPNSVHGSNVFKDFRKKRDQQRAVMAANNATVDASVHSAS